METRELGHHVLELETGPYTFLISRGTPVAYQDRSPNVAAPGLYRTALKISKATSRNINLWIANRQHTSLPQEHIEALFSSISRFESPEHAEKSPLAEDGIAERYDLKFIVNYMLRNLEQQLGHALLINFLTWGANSGENLRHEQGGMRPLLDLLLRGSNTSGSSISSKQLNGRWDV